MIGVYIGWLGNDCTDYRCSKMTLSVADISVEPIIGTPL